MALITLIGRLNKYFLFIAAIVFFSVGALAQTSQPVCTPSNYAAQVRPEGLTEPVGDLVLVCTGGTAGAVVAPNIFFLTLNTNITNRLDANGIPLGITISVNTGGGAVNSPATVQLYSPTTLGLNGFQYTVPTPATNPVTIDMHGLRAAVATIAPNPNTPTLVTASVTATGLQVTPMQPINLGFVTNPGLLDSVINNEIPCYGPTEPAPSIGFAAFVSSGIFATSVRISEGNATAFATKLAGDDNGTRIVLHISGYGTSTVYVPDAIVGNDGMMPTSDGAFGLAASGGQFTAGSTQLLLSRVNDADVNGVGGVPVVAVPGQTTTFERPPLIP
jgi:hypothetical protein